VDLLWDPTGTWQNGLINGGTRLVDKKNQSFTFRTLFYGLEVSEAACESGIHIFIIDQINESKEEK
jgi:hypothetical protein